MQSPRPSPVIPRPGGKPSGISPPSAKVCVHCTCIHTYYVRRKCMYIVSTTTVMSTSCLEVSFKPYYIHICTYIGEHCVFVMCCYWCTVYTCRGRLLVGVRRRQEEGEEGEEGEEEEEEERLPL